MSAVADSMLSSSARPLPVRRRPDLRCQRLNFQGRVYWAVKEPVGLNYFYLLEDEYAIFQMLDGQTSLDQIRQRYETQFAPQPITLEELHQFLGTLHQSGLLLSEVPGQGEQLLKRRGEKKRRNLLGTLSNILWLRFRGVDPERFFNWLHPRVKWVYHPAVLMSCLLLVLAAVTLVIVHFDQFIAKLPDFHSFFSVRNAFLLALVLAATKVLHELGHGVTCKHFGGECHEIGVMILVLTPCLFCDTTDSWLLPNKWHRAAIGAGGMFVEVVLAAVCTFVWWYTEPGLLHYLCLNVMFLSSVSTILFNGNPLLRFDGYFILADLLEIPNLRQKATTILTQKAGYWFLGIEPPNDPDMPQNRQWAFVLYTVAAFCYRWFIVFSILFFLNRVFEPMRLQIIGQAMIAASLFGLIAMPIWRLGRHFYVPGRLEEVKRPRLLASLAVLAVLAAAFFLIKFPRYVVCTLEIQPQNAATVYVDVPGTLASIDVKPSEEVVAGQPLARLENTDIDLRVAELTAMRERLRVKLENLHWQRHRDPSAAVEVAETQEALHAIQQQLAKRRLDQQRLVLAAPSGGTVLPPPWTQPQDAPEGRLTRWSGTPLQPENLGCLLQEGTLFCQIGDPRRMEAVLAIDQADVELVRKGQTVRILLDQLPGQPFSQNDVDGGPVALTITEVSRSDLKVSPKRLSTKAGGELPTHTDASGVERPMSATYQARVPLDDPQGCLYIGLRGTARIRTGSASLATRLWRLLMQTINFRL